MTIVRIATVCLCLAGALSAQELRAASNPKPQPGSAPTAESRPVQATATLEVPRGPAGTLAGPVAITPDGQLVSTVPPKQQDPFEAFLSQVLAQHPEIRLAQASVAEAEARLALTRMEVSQRIFTLWSNHEDAKQQLDFARRRLEEMRAMVNASQEPRSALDAAELEVLARQRALVGFEREMQFMKSRASAGVAVANPPMFGSRSVVEYLAASAGGNAPPADPVRTRNVPSDPSSRAAEVATKAAAKTHPFIEKRFEATAEVEMPLTQFGPHLAGVLGCNVIVDRSLRDGFAEDDRITLPATKGLTGREYLSLMADHTGFAFVVRDYGVFMISGEVIHDFRGEMTIPARGR